MLPMFTAAFAIPFCISAVVDGGPATLITLVLVTAVTQLIISRWLFLLRRLVTPGTGRHRDDDTFDHAGLGGATSVGRGCPGRACRGASDRPCHHRRSRHIRSARVGCAASLGTCNRHNLGLRGCSDLRLLQRRHGARGSLDRTTQPVARTGTGLQLRVLDSASSFPVPRDHHLRPGQRRSHHTADGRMA